MGVPALERLGDTSEECFAALLAPIALGLDAAHQLGLVHRDIKPSNILVHRDGRAVLADFGLARDDSGPMLSMTGDAIGTPSYMSPEQAGAARENIDHRTDIYSLGVTLYEALCGKRPLEGPTALAVLDAIRHERPPSVRSRAGHVSRNAEAVVAKDAALQDRLRGGA